MVIFFGDSTPSGTVGLPWLRELELQDMPELERWDGIQTGGGFPMPSRAYNRRTSKARGAAGVSISEVVVSIWVRKDDESVCAPKHGNIEH